MILRHALLAAVVTGIVATATASAQTPAPATAPESTGDFNIAGDVSTLALIGASIRNESKDTVGTVEDLFVDDQGAIATAIPWG